MVLFAQACQLCGSSGEYFTDALVQAIELEHICNAHMVSLFVLFHFIFTSLVYIGPCPAHQRSYRSKKKTFRIATCIPKVWISDPLFDCLPVDWKVIQFRAVFTVVTSSAKQVSTLDLIFVSVACL